MKTRRPIGCRNDPDGPDPDTDVRTFHYREDALVDAKALESQRWVVRVLYSGAWDRWFIEAKRKSWGYGRPALLRKDGSVTRVEYA